MPSIVFSDLVYGLISNQEIVAAIEALVRQKQQEPERSSLGVPSMVYREFVNIYKALKEKSSIDSISKEYEIISNDDFRGLLDKI